MRAQRLNVPPQGCTTCPYRRDTPPGIWAAEEYEKLRAYDQDPFDPIAGLSVFHCHQENLTHKPTVCRGWLSVHQESVAVRLAQAIGAVAHEDVPRAVEPLYYATGNEAADAGMAGVLLPPPEARREIDRLIRNGLARPE